HPDYSFVFIGPIQTDISSLKEIRNLHFLGPKSHESLPYYVNEFAVGIIPYLLTDYTKNVYPTKLNEYLALGKPVVSTELPEIMTFNEKYGDIVSTCKDPKEFSSCLERAVHTKSNEQDTEKRIRVANDNTWQKRIEQMSDLIEEGVERRKHDKDLKWREYFRQFYRKTRRKLVIAGIVCLLVYLFSFHTPLLWLVARPLKVSQAPRVADVIVTFAGGVGESGKAGQGYRERVTHSVNLYKKGFAQKMIFSTGYVYVMQEAEVMKALAVHLGVPSEDIILEKRAGS
ncbi:MAG: glycosyltransferase, partial [Candidatus Aenigmarchaeota archaeon]|nr:glycosyltransferase [Candidatus Aenigmarchaeota archaeon]